ncbi:MAG TPA: DUF2497 domain-containing protein [Phenylobacterium sp.]|nr:DUF2497 domain-containing protein [Phenylobacterium sp.]
MSETSSQEPTMEEILASIRRIISEDEAPAAAPELPIPPPEDVPPPRQESSSSASEPTTSFDSGNSLGNEDRDGAFSGSSEPHRLTLPEDDEDDGDLELTQRVETHGDLDVVAAMPPPEPEPEVAPPPLPGEGLVSDPVAAVTAATFGKLTSDLLVPHSDRTLEDVVRDLLRPLLQSWLDENLPGIVQRAVETEVERIARGRVR